MMKKNEIANLINTINTLKQDMMADYNTLKAEIAALRKENEMLRSNNVSHETNTKNVSHETINNERTTQLRKENNKMLKMLSDEQRVALEKAYNPIWAKINKTIDINNKQLRSAKFVAARNKLLKSMYTF